MLRFTYSYVYYAIACAHKYGNLDKLLVLADCGKYLSPSKSEWRATVAKYAPKLMDFALQNNTDVVLDAEGIARTLEVLPFIDKEWLKEYFKDKQLTLIPEYKLIAELMELEANSFVPRLATKIKAVKERPKTDKSMDIPWNE